MGYNLIPNNCALAGLPAGYDFRLSVYGMALMRAVLDRLDVLDHAAVETSPKSDADPSTESSQADRKLAIKLIGNEAGVVTPRGSRVIAQILWRLEASQVLREVLEMDALQGVPPPDDGWIAYFGHHIPGRPQRGGQDLKECWQRWRERMEAFACLCNRCALAGGFQVG